MINFWINILERRAEFYAADHGRDRIKFFCSFFYTILFEWDGLDNGIQRIMRWLMKKGPQEARRDPLAYYSKWIIPVNMHNYHWSLMVVRIATQEIEFYDSIPDLAEATQRMAHTLAFVKVLAAETQHDVSKWQEWKCELKASPQQDDGFDCGLFVIVNAELEALGIPFNADSYCHGEIRAQNIRMKVACEILKYPPK